MECIQSQININNQRDFPQTKFYLCLCCQNKTADVYVLGEPKDIALGQNCELNVKLHRIIVRIAAAEIFGNKNKPIRRDGLLKLAYDEIDNLNEKYIIKESITPP